MRTRREESFWALGIAIIVAALMIALFSHGFFWRSEARAGDALQGGIKPVSSIVIIGIDEPSIEELGRYPWDRDVYSELLDRLHSARIVGFDIGFFEPSGQDDAFIAAVESAQEKGVPVVVSEELIFTEQGEQMLLPVDGLREISSQGYSNLLMDPDGVVRRVAFDLVQDHLPFAARIAELLTGHIAVPQQAHINFVGAPGTFDRISFQDAVDDSTDPAFFDDKIVLVGAVAPDLHDTYLTPVSHGERMPGVEIHATILQMIMSRDYILPVDRIVQYTLILLFSMIGAAIFLLSFIRFKLPPLMLLGIIPPVLYLFIAIIIFKHGILLPITTPIVAFVLGAGLPTGRYLVKEQAEKRKLKTAFGKYVSPVIINEIMRDPTKLTLGGDRRELTILFSDIRNFTSLSEKMDPEDLVAFLNHYLTDMAQVVMEHGGLVDKYIGDAIMALWNAPVEQENHEQLACRAALKMIIMLQTIKQKYTSLNIGIGIHTGEAVVGNMGSEDRFDYTAIGDNVNLASRLEGLTKQYGVQIIISEETRKGIGAGMDVRKLDMVRVKGKQKPVMIYELVKKRKPEHDTFEEALERYFDGKFTHACKLFKKVGDSPSKVFLERIEVLNKQGRSKESWDGVWTHESK